MSSSFRSLLSEVQNDEKLLKPTFDLALDLIDAARTGSVNINSNERETVPLLRWMALQAGEQSTDVEENESATESDLVFVAAVSDRTMFVDPYNDSTADRLVDSFNAIYSLVETAPVAEQSNLEEMLEDELLDILENWNNSYSKILIVY